MVLTLLNPTSGEIREKRIQHIKAM